MAITYHTRVSSKYEPQDPDDFVRLKDVAAIAGGRFEQTYAAAVTHLVGHNLGQRLVSVQCVDPAGNVILPDIDFTSINVCTLTWSQAVEPTVVIRR